MINSNPHPGILVDAWTQDGTVFDGLVGMDAPVVASSQYTEVNVTEEVEEETNSTPVENEPIERKKKYDFNNLLGKIKEFLDNVE